MAASASIQDVARPLSRKSALAQTSAQRRSRASQTMPSSAVRRRSRHKRSCALVAGGLCACCKTAAVKHPSSPAPARRPTSPLRDRKSVGEGKGVSVRVDLGGRRIIKKKIKKKTSITQRRLLNKQKRKTR